MARTNILITGSAGLVGMHVLYELLGAAVGGRPIGSIHAVLRPGAGGGAARRLERLLVDPYVPSRLRSAVADGVGRVRPIEADLRDAAALTWAIREAVPAGEPLTVVHCAGSVNLETSGAAADEVAAHNVHGTRVLLDALGGRAGRFIHVSTAYCAGVEGSAADDDYLNLPSRTFRNPYERSKASAETELAVRCAGLGIDLHILRPSIICGRVVDAPLYYTPKFDVFYGWLRFFWQMRKAGLARGPVRLCIPADSTMNVVPVDFVARVIAKAVHEDVGQLNIVNPDPVSTRAICTAGLSCIGFDDVRFVEAPPTDPTRLEEVYASSVGKLFEAYIEPASRAFSARKMLEFMVPDEFPVMLPHLPGIVSFAADHDFDERRIAAPGTTIPIAPVAMPLPQFDGPRAWEAT